MMEQLIWEVYNFDPNKQKIIKYNILAFRVDFIKKLKKTCATKQEFTEELKSDLRWQYWSRAEYELIIKITEDDHILLLPWCGCSNPEAVAVDVTEDKILDWMGFAKEHINRQVFRNEAKIDIWDQISYGDRFKRLVDYYWDTKRGEYHD